MRVSFSRLFALAAGVAIVVSCDGAPTTTRIGSGISGGPTGTAPIVPPPPGAPDSSPPILIMDQPLAPAPDTPLVNVGDSIFVQVRLSDGQGLANVRFVGVKESGDPDLGTFQRTVRYSEITVPSVGQFRAGLTDTMIRRFLRPATPLDTTLGLVFIEATGEDLGGNETTVRRVVKIVAGPKVFIEGLPDSIPIGRTSTFRVIATHPVQVARDSVIISVPASWPTPITPTPIVTTFPSGTTRSEHEISITVPPDAVNRTIITINAFAFDNEGNPGRATPVTAVVRPPGTRAPRVFQTVPARMERTDSFTVTAEADGGIARIGRYLIDKVTRDTLRVDTVTFTEIRTNRDVNLPLVDSLGLQGKRLDIISFAIDDNVPALIGYSMQPGSSTPITSILQARIDTTLVTFGTTFAAPVGRSGVMGDLLVDPSLGNVFLSNTSSNLLEVWDNETKTFADNGIAVGAQPWGMFLSSEPGRLLVGNSGATTISRVFIGTNDKTLMREELNRRIRTRDVTIFQVRFARDPDTGRITLSRLPNVSYSDRPQYVVESAGGRIFFSTRPTAVAPAGTIRWLDPALPFPDPQQITSYGTFDPALGAVYSIYHADSVFIAPAEGTTGISDTLFIYDHPYGQFGPTIVANDSFPVSAISKIRLQGSDAFTILNMDMSSLELTDTTFVAASGDRQWIGFGEGNTQGPGATGRIMMVNDLPATAAPGFFSPAITVTDIVHNASEKVFGIAIDATGLQITSHGLQTYMASLDLPFHLRLDGVYDSFDNGAGVAYHPQANSTLSQVDQRISFSATASGVIEIIDVAHYNNRGQLITKGNLYGPLRASLPLPGDNENADGTPMNCPTDPGCVVLKLFGLTNSGMIVIDIRAADIKAGA